VPDAAFLSVGNGHGKARFPALSSALELAELDAICLRNIAHNGTRQSSVSAAKIIEECLESGDEKAWTAFVRHFQPYIKPAIQRVVRRYEWESYELTDNLVQDTYLRLLKGNAKYLRELGAKDDAAIGFVRSIATSVALDNFCSDDHPEPQAESDVEQLATVREAMQAFREVPSDAYVVSIARWIRQIGSSLGTGLAATNRDTVSAS